MFRICGSVVLLLLLFSNERGILGCAKREIAMLTVLKVISLTGVCSYLAVAVPWFVGVDAVGDTKSNSISIVSIGQGNGDIINNITQLFPTAIVPLSCLLLPRSGF